MPVGQSGLNTNNKLVFIMEYAYTETRNSIVEFTKYAVLRMYIIGICALILTVVSIVFSFMNILCTIGIPILIAIDIISIVDINKLIKRTYHETEINAPNKILFGKEYNILEVNEKDVLDTTMILNRGLGLIQSRKEVINLKLLLNLIFHINYIIVLLTIILIK